LQPWYHRGVLQTPTGKAVIAAAAVVAIGGTIYCLWRKKAKPPMPLQDPQEENQPTESSEDQSAISR
jgi:hypothetical protein